MILTKLGFFVSLRTLRKTLRPLRLSKYLSKVESLKVLKSKKVATDAQIKKSSHELHKSTIKRLNNSTNS
jgi:hypothetical protein